MIYFTADTHFGTTRLVTDGFRKDYGDIREHDAALIELWNDVVSEDDIVFILGDFIGVPEESKLREVVPQLNGGKILLYGNNDIWLRYRQDLVQEFFISAQDYIEFLVGPTALTLTHYPLSTWNKSGVGALSIHGHIHLEGLKFLLDEDYEPRMNRFCCCSDMWFNKPITLTDMINRWPERFYPCDVGEYYLPIMPRVDWDLVFGLGKTFGQFEGIPEPRLITQDEFKPIDSRSCFLAPHEVSPVKDSLRYFSCEDSRFWPEWEMPDWIKQEKDMSKVCRVLASRVPIK